MVVQIKDKKNRRIMPTIMSKLSLFKNGEEMKGFSSLRDQLRLISLA